jgi:hypothetical protein
MRNKIIALAAAVALGTAAMTTGAMTTSAMAFGHGGGGGGGHGGGFGGGHAGGFGGGHFGGGFAGVRGGGFGPHGAVGGFGRPGMAMNGGWNRGGWGHGGWRRGIGASGLALGLGGLYAYSPGYDYGYCDPTDPNTYIYGYCNGFANGW